jgi:hypothetical protein
MELSDLSIQGTSSPINVALDSPIKISKLYLKHYTFDGVPVTSGYPDQSCYNLVIENANGGLYTPLISTGKRGLPLPLTATHTTQTFDSPLLILKGSGETSLQKFTIRILNNSDGTDATITNAVFLFQYI